MKPQRPRRHGGAGPPRVAAVAASMLLALWLAGCATAPRPRAAASTGATLEVLNRTEVDLWVSVRGRVEGTARSGARLRVRHLTPGPAVAEVRPAPDARASAQATATFQAQRTELSLRAGETARWAVGEALPPPPALGDLTVTNRLPRDMSLRVDGRAAGVILAGDTRTLLDLSAGPHALDARDRGSKTVLDTQVKVPADGAGSWVLEAPSGRLTIINDTSEPVAVQADDLALGTLGPGERRTWTDIATGPHELTATSAHQGNHYQRALELRPGVPQVWGLSAGSATVILVNRTGEDVTAVPIGSLVPSAARTISLPAGARLRIEGVVPGRIGLNAVTAKTGRLYKLVADVSPGQVYSWEIVPADQGLRVVNRTGEALRLYVAGRPRGEVAAGSSRVLYDLPKGAVAVEALDVRRYRYTRPLPAAPRLAATWEIRARTGAVRVANKRPERLTVYVDARRVGEVPRGGDVTFTGVPEGDRLVEVVGARSGATLSAHAVVRPDTAATTTFRDPRGLLTVENRSGEPLAAQGALAQQQGLIPPGGRARYALPPGHRAARLLGRRSGLVYDRAVDLATDAEATWVVAAPTGTLIVHNGLDEAVAVSVDGQNHGALSPSQELPLAGTPAGEHTLRAQGLRSGRLQTAHRRLSPDGVMRWDLMEKPARLLVDNRGQEPLLVDLDGRPYGRVEAESRKIFGGLPAGRALVAATAVHSGVRQEVEVGLEPARTDVVTFHPPYGTVIIDNTSGEAVRVVLGREQLGRIAAGRPPTPIPVPAGLRVVRLLREGSQIETTYRLQVQPSRSIHLAVRSVRAKLAVSNRGPKPLTVWVGARSLGEVAPGASLLADDLAPGPATLRAKDADGVTRATERRTLEGGVLSSWLLP